MVYKTVEVEVEIDCDEECECEVTDRETDMRLSLYRAVYAGDMDEAENIANLMGMIGIDRDIVWQARQEVRKAA